MPEKIFNISNDKLEEFRQTCQNGGVTVEYHLSKDICALFKARDLVLIKKSGPDAGKKKKVLSWMKKAKAEIEEILSWQEWS